jgi:hypothetical protein
MVAGMVVVTFCLGILVPIYSDEVAIHMSRARFFLEDGQLVNLFSQCNSNVTMSVPLTWYPAAMFYGLLFSAPGWISLRLTGIVIGLVWLYLLWFWIGKLAQGSASKNVLRALAFSFNGLGVLPFVLILARSEQILILCLVVYCLFSIYWQIEEYERPILKVTKLVIFISLTSIFYYTHPKAIFFFPFVMVSAFLIFKKINWPIKISVLILTGLMTFQAIWQAQAISECREAPILARALSQNTIDFHQLAENKTGFYLNAWSNIRHSLGSVLDRLSFVADYQSDWLPHAEDHKVGAGIVMLNAVIQKSLFLCVIGMLFVFAVQLSRQLADRHIRPHTLLASVLVFGLLVHGLIYKPDTWHFYTPGLIVPVIILIFLLVLPTNSSPGKSIKLAGYVFVGYWMFLAVISMSTLLYLMLPHFIKIIHNDNYAISEQPLSTPTFISKVRRNELSGLANKCNIDTNNAERLVLDTATYFAFKNNKQPINILYVSDYGFGMDIGNNIGAYLNRMNSGGIIAKCAFLPEVIQKDAVRSGEMCCVSKASWLK